MIWNCLGDQVIFEKLVEQKKKELHDLKTIEHEFLLRIETFI